MFFCQPIHSTMILLRNMVICIILLFAYQFLMSTGARTGIPAVKLERIKCTSTVCAQFGCKIIRQSARIQALDGFCNLPGLIDHVRLRTQLFFRYKRYMPFLYDMDIDVCDYLGNRTQFQPALDFFRGLVEKYTRNVNNQTCPVSGNVTVNGLRYDMAMLSNAFVPAGQYRADLRVYQAQTNATIFDSQAFLSKL